MPIQTNTPCAVCSLSPPLYKCPRCAVQSCSQSCATRHKSLFQCSGERDKSAFVPINQFSWGTMMDDYTYLEDVTRKLSHWSNTIDHRPSAGPHLTVPRGRLSKRVAKRSRRDLLCKQLASLCIFMVSLPQGMSKRHQNKSFWNSKTGLLMLSIECTFHPTDNADSPFRQLFHENDLQSSLWDSLCLKILKPQKHLPPWLNDDAFVSHLASCAVEVIDVIKTNSLPKLLVVDPKLPLKDILQQVRFIEFPHFHFWSRGHSATETPDRIQQSSNRREVENDKSLTSLAAYGSDDEDSGPSRTQLTLPEPFLALGRYDSESDNNEPHDGSGLRDHRHSVSDDNIYEEEILIDSDSDSQQESEATSSIAGTSDLDG